MNPLASPPIPSSLGMYPLRLFTERLEIRPLTLDDVADWQRFMSDPVALRYFPMFDPANAEVTAREWVQRQLDRYRDGLFGLMAVCDRKNGAFLGQCGLLTQEVDDEPMLEIGYSLLNQHHGKGYATEAAQRIKAFAAEKTLADRIVSIIHVDNIPSRKVAERNGMRVARESTWRDLPIVVYQTDLSRSGA